MQLTADDSLIFLTVCLHGSFQGAADALGVASTTVGRRISSLERVLETPLFTRSNRQLELTEAGRIYQDRCQRLTPLLEDAANAVRTLMTHPVGHLRVAAPGGVIQAVLGEVAIAFAQSHPAVTLDVISSLENQVPDGETLHLAVWTSDGTPPFESIQRTIGRIDMVLCASPEWANAHPIQSVDELAEHPCVVQGASRKAAHVEFWTPDGVRKVDVSCGLFTTSTWLTREAAVRGLGPAGLPRAVCQRLLDTGELVQLLPDVRLAPAPIRLIYASRHTPYRLTAFMEALVAALQPYLEREDVGG